MRVLPAPPPLLREREREGERTLRFLTVRIKVDFQLPGAGMVSGFFGLTALLTVGQRS